MEKNTVQQLNITRMTYLTLMDIKLHLTFTSHVEIKCLISVILVVQECTLKHRMRYTLLTHLL